MCTDFTTDFIWMNTMCAVSLANHLRAVADPFRPLRTHQRYWTTDKWIYIYIYIYVCIYIIIVIIIICIYSEVMKTIQCAHSPHLVMRICGNMLPMDGQWRSSPIVSVRLSSWLHHICITLLDLCLLSTLCVMNQFLF